MIENSVRNKLFEFTDREVTENLFNQINGVEMRYCSYLSNTILVSDSINQADIDRLLEKGIRPMMINTVVFLRLLENLCKNQKEIEKIAFQYPVSHFLKDKQIDLLNLYNSIRSNENAEELLNIVMDIIIFDRNTILSLAWIEHGKYDNMFHFEISSSGCISGKVKSEADSLYDDKIQFDNLAKQLAEAL